jgi:hypothetical protein
MELIGELARVREDEDGLRGCAHHVKGELQLQQLVSGELEDGDLLGAPWEPGEEDEAWGLSSSNSGEVEGDVVKQQHTGSILRPWGWPSSYSSSSSSLLFLLSLLCSEEWE